MKPSSQVGKKLETDAGSERLKKGTAAAHWRSESRIAIPTKAAMVPIKPISSVNRIKLDLLFE
jgi:hypothetical protein